MSARTSRYAHETVAAECEGELVVMETDTRDAIKLGKRTIAYVAIGAEAWGPLLAACTQMRTALELIQTNAMTALAYSAREGNDKAAADRLRNINDWPGMRAAREVLDRVST